MLTAQKVADSEDVMNSRVHIQVHPGVGKWMIINELPARVKMTVAIVRGIR